jgi:Ni,Fe-hydrogenase III component G
LIEGLQQQLMAERHNFVQRDGNGWLEFATAGSTQVARMFRDGGARLVSITALQTPAEEEVTLFYHFDVGAVLYSVRLETSEQAIDSIAEIMPAAEWAEREIHESYGVTFIGRRSPRPLLSGADGGPKPVAGPDHPGK